jgi:uncharacterized protein
MAAVLSDNGSNVPVPPSITRIFVRPLGNPLPLGFFAFAMAMVLLSAAEFRWVQPREARVLVAVLLGYIAPLELLACIFGFLSRDTGTATSMGIFGTTWIALGISYLVAGLTATTTVIGIFLIMDALAVLCIATVTLATKPLLAILLFLAGARFFLAALLQFGTPAGLRFPAGVLGLVTGGFAVYGGLALLFEDTKQRAILPMFRRGAGKQVIEGTLEQEFHHLEREAGVRQQL